MGEFREYADLYASVVVMGIALETLRILAYGAVIYFAVRKAIEHSTSDE